jgi:hypothetical protein
VVISTFLLKASQVSKPSKPFVKSSVPTPTSGQKFTFDPNPTQVLTIQVKSLFKMMFTMTVLTVPELIQSIAAHIDGTEIAPHLTVTEKGHVELMEDDNTGDANTQEEARQLSIPEIIDELQLGRGKRIRKKSYRYGSDYESH